MADQYDMLFHREDLLYRQKSIQDINEGINEVNHIFSIESLIPKDIIDIPGNIK